MPQQKREIRKTTFLQQAAILTAASFAARFLGFLYRLPVTDIIGDEGNAIYTQSYYIYSFMLVLSTAGLPAAISKMVSERAASGRYRDAYGVFKTALLAAVFLGGVCFLILMFGSRFIAELTAIPESYMSLMALAPTVLIVAVTAVFRGYFQGMGTTVPTALSQVVDQVFNAVFSILLTWILFNAYTGSREAYAMGAAGSTLGTGIGALAGLLFILYMFFLARPTVKTGLSSDRSRKQEPRRRVLGELLAISGPIILGTAIFTFTNIIDASMIVNRLTFGAGFDAEKAKTLYGQLSGKFIVLTTLPITISTSLATAAIPSIASSLALGKKKEADSKINKSLRVAMILSVPAAAGMGVLAPQIYRLLFPSYSAGAELLQAGAVSIIFLAITQITTGMLQATGKVKIPVIAALCGVSVKILLNYLLISLPSVNIMGAIVSTIVCYAITASIDWAMLCRHMKIKPDFNGILFKPLFSSVVMALAAFVAYWLCFYVLNSNAVSLVLAIGAGVAVYFAALAIVGGIHREDVKGLPIIRKFMR